MGTRIAAIFEARNLDRLDLLCIVEVVPVSAGSPPMITPALISQALADDQPALTLLRAAVDGCRKDVPFRW